MPDRRAGYFRPERSASGHLRSICNLFRKARNKAGLPKELVSLLCATRLWYASSDANRQPCCRNENDGAPDVKTAMHYQHPELEIVRAALDYRPPNSEAVV